MGSFQASTKPSGQSTMPHFSRLFSMQAISWHQIQDGMKNYSTHNDGFEQTQIAKSEVSQ